MSDFETPEITMPTRRSEVHLNPISALSQSRTSHQELLTDYSVQAHRFFSQSGARHSVEENWHSSVEIKRLRLPYTEHTAGPCEWTYFCSHQLSKNPRDSSFAWFKVAELGLCSFLGALSLMPYAEGLSITWQGLCPPPASFVWYRH